MQFLRQSTIGTILIGTFVDKTDGVTGETAIGLSTADSAELMKHNGTAFVDISSNTFASLTGGMYALTLSATDTNTLGRMSIFIADESVCLPVWKDFMVLPANIYDSLISATDYLKTDMTEVEGTDATDALDTQIRGVLGTALVSVGRLAAQGSADANAACDTALSDYDAPTRAELDTAIGTAKVTVGSNTDKTGYSLAADQQVNTTKIEGADATDTLDTRIRGVLGTALISVGRLATQASADTGAAVTTSLNSYDPPTRAEIDTAIGTAKVTVGSNADKTGYSLAADQEVDVTKIEGADATDTLDARIRGVIGTALVSVGRLATQASADVNAAVDTALNTAIPSSPTANSVNERVKAVDDKLPSKTYLTGSTDSDGGVDSTEANVVADAVLSRDVDQVETAAPVHSLCVAVLKAVSKIKDNAGTLEVYQTDGATLKMSQVITTDASNEPIDELTVGA